MPLRRGVAQPRVGADRRKRTACGSLRPLALGGGSTRALRLYKKSSHVSAVGPLERCSMRTARAENKSVARYKLVDRSPRFLPIVLESQLVSGSFEHALDVLIDTEIDLSGLAARFCNDETGAPAYDPAVMLKIVRSPTAGAWSPAARSSGCAGRTSCSWRSPGTAPRRSPRWRLSSRDWARTCRRSSPRCCWSATGGADRAGDVRHRRGETPQQRRQGKSGRTRSFATRSADGGAVAR